MSVAILTGDCRDVLRTLPDESVHCVVTSPPYWGLRDYGVAGQLGLEECLADHVGNMVNVFSEVKRVLRTDGTLWLNYGDSYATSVNGRSAADTKAAGNDDRTFRDKPFSTIGPVSRVGTSGNKGNSGADHGFRIWAEGNLKPKDLCGIPWRVAFALQADGWYLRQDIIWSKPNPMPESVRDRCTKAHEYLFLLSKSERYFYDAEAMREDCSLDSHGSPNVNPGVKNIVREDGGSLGKWTAEDKLNGRNKRSVWEIATAPFAEAHFATFPPALIEPCILAGCPKECCAKCGAPWVREVERTVEWPERRRGKGNNNDRADGGMACNAAREIKTLGWLPSCSCARADADGNDFPLNAGTCLDPFGGAGTTGLVADRLGRNAVLIELNPEYAVMAKRRITDDAGMFAEVG